MVTNHHAEHVLYGTLLDVRLLFYIFVVLSTIKRSILHRKNRPNQKGLALSQHTSCYEKGNEKKNGKKE